MAQLRKIRGLLYRAQNADAADHELDAEIWLAFTPGVTRKKSSYTHKASGREVEVDETREAGGRLITVPTVTGSIDDAMGLVRQHYPNIGIILESGYRGPYSCCSLRRQDGSAFTTGTLMGQQSRPDYEMPLAIVAAFLMAKEAECANVEDIDAEARQSLAAPSTEDAR